MKNITEAVMVSGAEEDKYKRLFGSLLLYANNETQKNTRVTFLYYAKPYPQETVLAAKKLLNFIEERPVGYLEFKNFDSSVNQIVSNPSLLCFWDETGELIKPSAFFISQFIAYCCAGMGLYFDDTNITPQEHEEMVKTDIGDALWAFECFESQQGTKSSSVQTTQQQTATKTHRTTSIRTRGNAPKGTSTYKTSGTKSQDIINLVGQPNQKIFLPRQWVCCVSGESITLRRTNTLCAFVRPLNAKANSKGTNEVFFGFGNVSGECRCIFDDPKEAEEFMEKCEKRFGNKYQNIHVGKTPVDRNGYFKVSTEFGDCYITAKRMNEQLRKDSEMFVESECENMEAKKRPVQRMSYEDVELMEMALLRNQI